MGMKQDAVGCTIVTPCTRVSNLQAADGPELSEPIKCDSIKEWAKADKLYSLSIRYEIPRERVERKTRERERASKNRAWGLLWDRLPNLHMQIGPHRHMIYLTKATGLWTLWIGIYTYCICVCYGLYLNTTSLHSNTCLVLSVSSE